MCKLLIFGGTTEGRELAQFCAENLIPAYISVTTEYGAKMISESVFIKVIIGKMTDIEMHNFIKGHNIKLVIDATHPYAKEATANITAACEAANIQHIRITRNESKRADNALYFNDINAAAAYLEQNTGNVLITTGSKELKAFCRLKNFRERCTVRVIPSEKIISDCVSMGFDRTRIIAEQGSFSEEQNIAHIRKAKADFLVTKDSGKTGGFDEKLSAADKCGVKLLIINRPAEKGFALSEAKEFLIGWAE